MKKYVKPALYFESFELSQNITVCGFDMNTTESMHCVAVSDETMWLDKYILFREGWCQDPIDVYDGMIVCYQNGENVGDFMRIYNS